MSVVYLKHRDDLHAAPGGQRGYNARPAQFVPTVTDSTPAANEPAVDTAKLLPQEKRAMASLAGVMALRMLGLFMLLPVLALYAEGFVGATPALIGLAVGLYGLTQAALQIPLGLLSDRIGRKPVITAGLLLFAAGSLLAASADSMGMLLLGRALQGAGAVAAALTALLADLTRDAQRTKAMAAVGASIGLSFMLALVLGPALAALLGVPGLFVCAAVAGLLAIGLLYGAVPTPPPPVPLKTLGLRRVLGDGNLLPLYAGIFLLHAMLMAGFVAHPLVLRDNLDLPMQQHWLVYLGVMLAAVMAMMPLLRRSHKTDEQWKVLRIAIVALLLAQIGFAVAPASLTVWVMLLWLFFTGFNILEASLPSMVSRLAPPEHRGAAMGVHATSQFLGMFAGGALGGVLLGAGGALAVFGTAAGLALLWLLIVWRRQ